MSKRERVTDASSKWAKLNTSELALMAQDFDANAHRGLERPTLIRILSGETTESLPTYRPDKYRLRIMRYMNENWERVEPLLRCPARSRDPHACFSCPDIQVAECSINNPTIFSKKDSSK